MNTREKLLLVWALGATGLVLIGGFILFQMAGLRLAEPIHLGAIEEFPIGSYSLFSCDEGAGRCLHVREKPQYQNSGENQPTWIWVTHDAPDTWKAWLAVSPHRGCFVNWIADRARFEEPCYGSQWKPDGSYLEGPSPRGLDSFPVRVENGDLLIDFKLIRGQPRG